MFWRYEELHFHWNLWLAFIFSLYILSSLPRPIRFFHFKVLHLLQLKVPKCFSRSCSLVRERGREEKRKKEASGSQKPSIDTGKLGIWKLNPHCNMRDFFCFYVWVVKLLCWVPCFSLKSCCWENKPLGQVVAGFPTVLLSWILIFLVEEQS